MKASITIVPPTKPVSSTTIAKMGKGEKVSLDVLERICEHFDCNIGDVISFEKENN